MSRTVRALRCAVAVIALGFAACGDEDRGGGPAGGFDDEAPEAPGSDDENTGTTASPAETGGGSGTNAGEPTGHIGNVEGEGDVNDLSEDDG